MNIRYLLVRVPVLVLILALPAAARGQFQSLRGRLADTSGVPVPGAAVSLLNPADSTMEAFGISDAGGAFEIRAVRHGNYLLQVAGMGYGMLYKPVAVPLAGDLGILMLRPDPYGLQDIEVKGAKVPVLLRGDTVEYNAGSFRVREDAITEDLLKKLPGVQVDNAGNIKALGKDVKRVLVDGKEFFGDDPKMATKNLPADAIEKVQVFGKRSDAATFTGIDDGVRDQTINLKMKKDRRDGYFGNVEAGGGTDAHYQGAARLYRFRPEQQIAALGMLNNINRFGFSFQDYLSFQGGLQNAGRGGRLEFSDDLPIDFGQPVPGLITSGAAGLNYSGESKRGYRSTFSYLGNGAGKRLAESRRTQNFSPVGTFLTADEEHENTRDLAHRVNAGWRTTSDSLSQISLHGSARLSSNRADRNLSSAASLDGIRRNSLQSLVGNTGGGYALDGSGSYIHKTGNLRWPVWELRAAGAVERIAAATDWSNTSTFLLDTTVISDRQYQRNETGKNTISIGGAVTRKLGRGLYLEPGLSVVYDENRLYRSQGVAGAEAETDSLSAGYSRRWTAASPSLGLRYNTRSTQLAASLEPELGELRAGERRTNYRVLKPGLFFQYAPLQSSQVMVDYTTAFTQPTAQQMIPLTNYLNPLQRIRGNTALRPEYSHSLNGRWLRFDQFSGMSLMASFRAVYTSDKISWARFIRQDLSEDLMYVNVASDYNLGGGVEFSTPVRRLGIDLSLSFDERFNQGLSYVNEVRNQNRSFNHSGRLRVESRKLKFFDIEAGLGGDITQARASVAPGRRSSFYHYNTYAQILWKPHTRFNLSLNASLDQYTSSGFDNAVSIPLINASASWYFLKLNRGVLTLDAFDLLNRNSAVQRISQLNVLMERQSNIVRQYAILSFKYRLSKAPAANSGVSVRVN